MLFAAILGGCTKNYEKERNTEESEVLLNKSVEDSAFYVYDNSLVIERIDNLLVEEGQEIFKNKCSECHRMEYKSIGPDISDLCSVRQPEWILNYLLDYQKKPKNTSSVKLFTQKKSHCPIIISDVDEAFAILDYLRQYRIWIHEFN